MTFGYLLFANNQQPITQEITQEIKAEPLVTPTAPWLSWLSGDSMTGVLPKPTEPTITVTVRLTPEPVETVLRQVTGADEEDWLDDPRLWQMLGEWDRHVAAEIWAGQWTTLEELQHRWARKKARAKAQKLPTS